MMSIYAIMVVGVCVGILTVSAIWVFLRRRSPERIDDTSQAAALMSALEAAIEDELVTLRVIAPSVAGVQPGRRSGLELGALREGFDSLRVEHLKGRTREPFLAARNLCHDAPGVIRAYRAVAFNNHCDPG